MTRDEALLALCKRASDNNLFINCMYGSVYVLTEGGDNLQEFREHFGGIVADKFRRSHVPHSEDMYKINDQEAVDLLKELMHLPVFRASGKYHYARDVVKQWEEERALEDS